MENNNKIRDCACCSADDPIYWKDNENNAFVCRGGEMLVTIKDHTMRFKVKYCPMCGRTLNAE